MKNAINTRLTKADIAELMDIEGRLASLSVEAREAADTCGLSRREIAMRMGNASPSTLQRLLKGMAYSNASLDTIARFAWACGYELQVRLLPKEESRQASRESQRGSADNVRFLDQYRKALSAHRGKWSGFDPPAAKPDFELNEFPRPLMRELRTAHGN